MPWWAAAFGVFLAKAVEGVVGKVLSVLGIGVVSYVGVDVAVNSLLARLHDAFSGVGGDILTFISLLGFDVYLSLTVSAFTTVIFFKVIGGVFKKFELLDVTGGGGSGGGGS